MTWGVQVTKADGTIPPGLNGKEQYMACYTCKHRWIIGGPAPACYIPKITGSLSSLITSVDTGSDNHSAGGLAILKCSGYEPQE